MVTRTHMWALLAILACGIAVSPGTHAQENRVVKGSAPPALRQRVDAIERLAESRNDESLLRFWEQQLSPAAQQAKSKDQWTVDLKEVRERCTGFGTIKVAPSGEWSFLVTFGETKTGDVRVRLELEPTAPNLIRDLKLESQAPTAAEAPSKQNERDAATPPLTWESLRDRLKAEEAAGFAGSVLLVRNGDVILHGGYGFADREKRIANRPETVFAIGSTPIDFTKVAILKLEDQGKLKATDPITKFLPNVPADKKGITIEQLMTGRSGLRNFHGRPTDADLDNSWIDRDTAVKRILEDELVFPPGTDRAHSHSAFGLLAAIVEVVSGEPIAAFYKKQLFAPAGMTRTGMYEEITAPQPEFAIGYGGRDFSSPNSPNHWGKTSWLVMGSGGMVSTTGDLHRFNTALRAGKIISAQAARKYWAPGGGFGIGGSDHGFYTALTEGPDNLMFLCSNVIGRPQTERLAEDLAALVNKPKFRVGIVLRPDPSGIVVDQVEPQSPAARAGLAAGDQIVALNGSTVDVEGGPGRIRELVSAGKPIEFKVMRDGKPLTFTVSPAS